MNARRAKSEGRRAKSEEQRAKSEGFANVIRSLPDDKRAVAVSADDLKTWRKEIDQQKGCTYLRDPNATQGESVKLVCWMEVS